MVCRGEQREEAPDNRQIFFFYLSLLLSLPPSPSPRFLWLLAMAAHVIKIMFVIRISQVRRSLSVSHPWSISHPLCISHHPPLGLSPSVSHPLSHPLTLTLCLSPSFSHHLSLTLCLSPFSHALSLTVGLYPLSHLCLSPVPSLPPIVSHHCFLSHPFVSHISHPLLSPLPLPRVYMATLSTSISCNSLSSELSLSSPSSHPRS